MRKLIAAILAVIMVIGLACACAEEVGTAGSTMLGSFETPEDFTVTEERQAIFDKGMEGLLGVGYTPVAYLGSQLVAGTNHAFLCQAKVVVPDAVPYWTIVYLYQDLEGNVSVLNIVNLDVGALNVSEVAE